jgi:23S rRNA pseudouridine1911/1915/1917 synthase
MSPQNPTSEIPPDNTLPFREFLVPRGEQPKRLDIYLSKNCLGFTRSRVQRLLEQKLVTINDVFAVASHKIRGGDQIRVFIPPPRSQAALPENIPLDILYEDDDLIVLSKPPGLVVHPAPGHADGTLVNGLLFHFQTQTEDLKKRDQPEDEDEPDRPTRAGLVHRLDQDTSGVMVIGKNESIVLDLMNQFKDRTVSKKYLALVKGILPKKRGEIDAPIGRSTHDRKKFAVRQDGKPSLTRYRVLETFRENCSLLEVTLFTGRTHQIRVHFRHLGFPLLGDTVYGPKGAENKNFPRQMLHAWKLIFRHPRSDSRMEFEAPLPPDFTLALERLTPFSRGTAPLVVSRQLSVVPGPKEES